MRKVYYWSPCLANVGTVISTLNSAISLSKYSKKKFDVNLINVCGEWDDYKEKLYKKFLVSRKNRLNIKNIYYLMDVYPSSREIIFSNFEIDEKNNKFYQNTTFAIGNWQDLRNMFNELLINYDG